MERRKVQRVGGGTYTVSIPKGWAERAELDAGTVVHVDTRLDDTLVVVPETPEDDATCRSRVRVTHESPERVERLLQAAYLAGFEELVVDVPEGLDRALRRTVDRVVRSFVGVGIVEESDDRILVRAMLDPGEVSVRQSLRQLQSTALSMHRDATAALLDGEQVHVADRDEDADRLYAMIDRHFGRGLSRLDEVDALGCDRSELFELRTAARELERVADHAETIATVADALDGLPPEVPRDGVASVADEARGAVEDAVGVVVGDADTGPAHRALERRNAVWTSVDDFGACATGDIDYRFYRALEALRRTAAHGGNLAELGLRARFRRGEATSTEVGTPAEGD